MKFLTILLLLPLQLHSAENTEPLTLDQFLSFVRTENVEIKLAAEASRGAEASASGPSLPPPLLGVSQFKDMSGNASGFEISQTIPFPSQLLYELRSRQADAEGAKAQNQYTLQQTLSEARFAFFRLWQSQERLSILQEKRSALKEHLMLATAGARSDSFLKIHLMKTESDIDLLENDILSAEQDLREQQILLAQMIQRSPSTFRPVASEPAITPLPTQEKINSPSLLVQLSHFRLKSLEARESEAKASWLPEFNLKYREMSGTAMNPKYNELMVGISLPFLYAWEPNRASHRARAERIQAELQLAQERIKNDARRASLLAKIQILKKQMTQLIDKILPRAEKRMHLVHHIAPRDMESLVDHREALEAFPELKMKNLELRLQYEEALLELMKTTSEATP